MKHELRSSARHYGVTDAPPLRAGGGHKIQPEAVTIASSATAIRERLEVEIVGRDPYGIWRRCTYTDADMLGRDEWPIRCAPSWVDPIVADARKHGAA